LKFVVPTVLLLVAAIHLLPLLGIVGPAQLQRLYGVPIQDPVLELLLRHRALLFGLLGGGLVLAAFKPAWHGAALVAASVSVAGFLVLAWSLPGSVSPAITTVVRGIWGPGRRSSCLGARAPTSSQRRLRQSYRPERASSTEIRWPGSRRSSVPAAGHQRPFTSVSYRVGSAGCSESRST
jgi:hypothetical protein